MTDVYVIRNQHGHYWGKSKEWVSGAEPRSVMRVKHRDEALNSLFELSSRDIELRGKALAVELSDRGEPLIEPSEIPLPGADVVDPGTEPAGERAVQPTDSKSPEAVHDT